MLHEMPSVLTRGLNLKKKTKLFSNFDLRDKECNVHSTDKGRMLQHKGSDAGNHKIFFSAFQPMTFVLNVSYLSSDQDTNWFLV